ncbi:MAG: SH3 domain-containing protein [Deltaproteobacteria bacterium]|nr:SH3 domain-containing protein [Deltaproteobacteria bacterium]
MRMSVPLLVLLLGVAWPTASHAEKVRTNANAKVYNRAGEQGKVVVKVKEGQSMTVLAKEGRWLKVRVSGRTGYIPRSKVDMPEGDDEFARNTRRRPFVDGRGTKRGFGGESGPDDRIGADATGDDAAGDDSGDEPAPKGKTKPKSKAKAASSGDDDDDGEEEEEPADAEDAEPEDKRVRASVKAKTVAYAEPNKQSDEQFKAKPGDVLFVEQTKGKWTEVSVEEGDIGWIQTSKLEVDEDGGGGGGNRYGRVMDVRARVGVTIVSQSLQAGGTGATTKWPDKYTVGSSSAAVMLGGALLYPYKARYLVGGELTYDLAKAIPGISFDPDGGGANGGPMPSQTTGFTIHNINARAVAGYDLRRKSGAILFGRLGYRYEAFQVANVTNLTKNNAKLPSENIQGPTIGLAFAVPLLTQKIGFRLSVDAMLIGGSVTQTKNLEDGADPSVKKIVIGAGVTYRWKPGIDLSGGYDLNYASLKFGAPVATSMRGHAGTSVARTDLNHTIAVGIAKAF